MIRLGVELRRVSPSQVKQLQNQQVDPEEVKCGFGQATGKNCYWRRHQLANEEVYLLALAHRYAYVLPQPHLLEVISRYSSLVELGAGTGYWAYLLGLVGADIVAYDMAPSEARGKTDTTPTCALGLKCSRGM